MKKSEIGAIRSRLLNSTIWNSYLRRSFGVASIMAGTAGALLLTSSDPAAALNLYNGPVSGTNNVVVNLDTTFSYTPIFRVSSPSDRLTSPTANANGSEGDIDFAHGLVSNTFEVLPVLDIKDGDYGAHFSGEGYLNTSYLGTNTNDQPATLNPFSVAKHTDFTSAVRNDEGLNARVLDAFVYGTEHFGTDDNQSFSVKFGRQTLLWGQSLFLSNNGIAVGMAPFDVIEADNDPNAETQQKIEPVGQVVLTYQPNPILTLQGYYQFEWEHDYFEGVGAYFSTVDILDKGGERLIPEPGLPVYFYRTKDLSPEHQNGQFGLSAQLALGDYGIGFYGLRFDSKAPAVYLQPGSPAPAPKGLSIGNYNLVYPRDIWIEGASISTNVGAANVAGELSFRQHMNLATGANVITSSTNANSNPAYPTGDTVAAQTSFIYVSSGIPLDPGGVTVDGEVGFNHVLAVTRNDAAIDSARNGSLNRSSTAAQFDVVATPTYYDLVPDLVLGLPVGFFYNFYGRSMIDSTENNGTGDVNVGVTGTYRGVWIASLTYQRYIGAANPILQGEPSTADRDFVLLNFQRTF